MSSAVNSIQNNFASKLPISSTLSLTLTGLNSKFQAKIFLCCFPWVDGEASGGGVHAGDVLHAVDVLRAQLVTVVPVEKLHFLVSL